MRVDLGAGRRARWPAPSRSSCSAGSAGGRGTTSSRARRRGRRARARGCASSVSVVVSRASSRPAPTASACARTTDALQQRRPVRDLVVGEPVRVRVVTRVDAAIEDVVADRRRGAVTGLGHEPERVLAGLRRASSGRSPRDAAARRGADDAPVGSPPRGSIATAAFGLEVEAVSLNVNFLPIVAANRYWSGCVGDGPDDLACAAWAGSAEAPPRRRRRIRTRAQSRRRTKIAGQRLIGHRLRRSGPGATAPSCEGVARSVASCGSPIEAERRLRRATRHRAGFGCTSTGRIGGRPVVQRHVARVRDGVRVGRSRLRALVCGSLTIGGFGFGPARPAASAAPLDVGRVVVPDLLAVRRGADDVARRWCTARVVFGLEHV